ncbi:MAG: hypothetical protein ACE5IM_14605 [Nitrospinota bacterium]
MAFTVLEMFLDRLAEEAGNSQGQLSIEDVRMLAERFKEQDAAESLARFRERFEACQRQREQDMWDYTRRRPFDRILVQRFSHFFPAEGGLDAGDHVISRRILPGFFIAFETMASAELFEQFQIACRGLLKAKKQEHGGAFRWKDLYEDEDVKALANDLIASVATHFADFDQRLHWLLQLINNNLAPPEDYAFEGDVVDQWTLREAQLRDLLRALFAEFREKLADEEGRHEVEQRYGEEACQSINDVVRALDAAP